MKFIIIPNTPSFFLGVLSRRCMLNPVIGRSVGMVNLTEKSVNVACLIAGNVNMDAYIWNEFRGARTEF